MLWMSQRTLRVLGDPSVLLCALLDEMQVVRATEDAIDLELIRGPRDGRGLKRDAGFEGLALAELGQQIVDRADIRRFGRHGCLRVDGMAQMKHHGLFGVEERLPPDLAKGNREFVVPLELNRLQLDVNVVAPRRADRRDQEQGDERCQELSAHGHESSFAWLHSSITLLKVEEVRTFKYADEAARQATQRCAFFSSLLIIPL